MKYILFFVALLSFSAIHAQFPAGTDTLRRFNNRFIDNDAKKAFTNLRLHNLLAGIIDNMDSIGSGGTISLGLDTLWSSNDSTLIYRKNGLFYNVIVRGATGAGAIYRVPFSDGAHLTNDSNFKFDKSQGADASRLIVGPTTVTTGGLAKINATSDNMNALGLTSYGTGANTIIFKRARGSITTPTKLLADDDLFNLSGRGYNGTDWVTTGKAAIYARTASDWASDSTGTKIYFRTTKIDSVNAEDRMLIDHNGQIGINTLAPVYGLHVNRSMAINKDSVSIVAGATSHSVIIIDTITGNLKRSDISNINKNYFNANLDQTANRSHNSKNFTITNDSIKTLNLIGRGLNFQGKKRYNYLYMDATNSQDINDFMWLEHVWRKGADDGDSARQRLVYNGNSGLKLESVNNISGGFSRLTLNGNAAILTGSLTLNIRGTPAASSDSVFGVGTYNTASLTNEVLKIPRLPYKVYIATLTQTGTSAPTATVLENTLGGTLVWTRTGQGQYLATLSGVFTANKTVIFCGPDNDDIGPFPATAFRTDVNSITLKTLQINFPAEAYIPIDDFMSEFSIEIRVYP